MKAICLSISKAIAFVLFLSVGITAHALTISQVGFTAKATFTWSTAKYKEFKDSISVVVIKNDGTRKGVSVGSISTKRSGGERSATFDVDYGSAQYRVEFCGTYASGRSGGCRSEGSAISFRAHRPPVATASDIPGVEHQDAPNHDPTVGVTVGEHSVGSDGSANYTIPINIIPGIAGMQPDLALSYNNNAGNGAFGVGWNMSGLSSIKRCPNDTDRFNANIKEKWHPVDFSSKDKFCYNGVRMVLISGSYGAVGSEYRLASENFTKIKIESGSSSYGPYMFKVWTKDGMIKTYGGSSSSNSSRVEKVNANGTRQSQVVTWALDEAQDRHGNYYKVEYEEPISGSFRVKQILYTGNKNTTLRLPNKLAFIYEDRTDDTIAFSSGAKVEQTWRVKELANYSGARKVRYYKFAYQYKKRSSRSFLSSVTECASNKCLPSTTFQWSSNLAGFHSSTLSGSNVFRGKNFVADFNRDGVDDLYSIDRGEVFIYEGSKSGSLRKKIYRPNHSMVWNHGFVADFNNDGRDDLAHLTDWTLYVHYATNTGFTNRQKVLNRDTSRWGAENLSFAGDYNRDGLADIMSIKKGSSPKAYIKINRGPGKLFEAKEYTLNRHGSNNWDDVWPGDFNGDGRTDIARRISNTRIVVYLWTGKGFVSNSWPVSDRWGGSKWIKTGDFNGDGLTDIASHVYENMHVKLSTGSGFKSETWTVTGTDPGKWCGAEWVFTSDFNGDGLTDFAQACGRYMYMKISTGTGFKGYRDQVADAWGQRNYAVQWDYNGDGVQDIVSESHGDLYVKRQRSKPIVLTGVTSGAGKINHRIRFEYKPLNDNSVYESAAFEGIESDSLIERRSSEQVISRVRESNGMDGYLDTEYKYMGLVYHKTRSERLGFQSMTTINKINGVKTTTYTNQNSFRKTHGLIDKIETVAPSGVVLSLTVNDWRSLDIDFSKTGKRQEIQLESTEVTKRDLNGAFLSFETTDYTFYDHGAPRLITNRVYSGLGSFSSLVRTKRTENKFTSANYDDWILPSIKSTVVSITSETSPGKVSISRRTEVDTNPLTGKVEAERTYSDEGVMTKEVKYEEVNIYGDHQKITVSGPDFVSRTSTTDYKFNATYNHLESITKTQPISAYVTQQKFYGVGNQNAGLLNIAIDINDFQTKHTYDVFGRNVKRTQFYGNSSLKPLSSYTSYQWCSDIESDENYCKKEDGGEPYYRIAAVADASPISYVFSDQLGREVRKVAQGPDGQYINVVSLYDADGYNVKVSEPFYTGDKIYYSEVKYDDLGRVFQSTSPDGRVDVVTFNGYERISRNDVYGKNQEKIEYRNAIDELVRVVDHYNTEIHYEYDSESKLLHTYMEAGSVTEEGATITYDALGRKKTLDDPDKGLWSYTYNGLDQLITQTNARGEITCHAYDHIGRNSARFDGYNGTISSQVGSSSDSTSSCRGAGSIKGAAIWLHHTDTSKKPFLGAMSGFYTHDGERSGSPSGFWTNYKYDGVYGRLVETIEQIDGNTLTTKTKYDDYHRPKTITYPESYSGTLVKATSVYNDIGFRYEVKNTSNNKTYYKVNEVDAYGNILEESFGNGVTTKREYDPETNRIGKIQSYGPLALTADPDIQDLDFDFDKIGNLREREDSLQGMSETAYYDDLNRLKSTTLNMGVENTTTSVMYNAFGNIMSKTGVGTYRYGQSVCGNSNAGPHAVTSISGTKKATYCYDRNGNMLSGDGRTIKYASFDKPIYISKGGKSTELFYNANRTLYKRIVDMGNSFTATHIYSGSYERVSHATAVEERYYVTDSVVVKHRTNSQFNESVGYLHKDHIGSITAITDDSGVIKEEFSFDAWGKRRAPNLPAMEDILGKWSTMSFYERSNLSILPGRLSKAGLGDGSGGYTNKGFTGHEQMDLVGLIHMGGRVYDAEIGRFISADPFVQDGSNTQAFNRYSYVENNPLSYTDPSGYFLKKVFKKLASFVGSHLKRTLSSLKGHLRFLGRIINAVPGLDTVIVVAGSIVCPPCAPFLGMAMAMLQSAIAYANGMPLGQALKGLAVSMATSAIMPGVGGRVAAGLGSVMSKKVANVVSGYLISGAMAKANGGKFIDGVKAHAKNGAITAVATTIGTAIGNGIRGSAKPAASASSGNTRSCNPINIATGEKYLTMRDYEAQGASKLILERYYSSAKQGGASMGAGWRTNFDKSLTLSGSESSGYFRAVFTRAEGDAVEFVQTEDGQGGASWKNIQSHRPEVLLRKGELWELHLSDNSVETYNTEGQLMSIRELGGYTQTLSYANHHGKQLLDRVEDTYSQVLTFRYDYKQRIKAVSANGQPVATYRYDLKNNLAKAIAVDGSFKAYHYDDNRFNHAITSITNHQSHKLHTMAYDAAGRAILSALGDDAERYDIVFEQGSDHMLSTVTNSAGKNTVYTFNDRNQPIKIEGHATATCLAANQGYTYNESGLLQSKVDWNDAETRYEYNERGLETLRIEAAGTPEERRIATQWHADYRLPVRVEVPGLITFYEYDAEGLLIKRTLRDTTQKRSAIQRLAGRYHDRVWHYTYTAQGLLATTDGPLAGNADVTTYAYNSAGQMTSTVNALGHQARTLAFNERGLPTLVEDANGVQTALRYNNRGWLTHKVLKGDGNAARPDEVTEYRYTGASDYLGKGLVKAVISPNGQSLHYGYDKARRLISQTNSQGERIAYTLDLEGNRTAQTVYSQTGEIVQQTRAVYDELSRLLKTIGADNRVIADYHYDKAGNQASFTDALGRETHYAYDALNRLVATSDVDGTIKQTYNAQDQLTQVTDQRGLTTTYGYNGFGEKITQISPDTGITTFEYNSAGLLVAKVDARSIVTEYRYDAIGRVTDVIYPAANDDNIHYTYDAYAESVSPTLAANDENLIGRLASVQDASGQTHYQYNHRGQVVMQAYSIGNETYQIAYAYDAVGQLQSTTYPSGRTVDYHQEHGRLASVNTTSISGEHTAIASGFSHKAFGPLTGLAYGNNTQLQLTRDVNNRISDILLTGKSSTPFAANDVLYDVSYLYDGANNITAINDAILPEQSQQFSYDASYRLTGAQGRYGSIRYDYDAVGNRQQRSIARLNAQAELESIKESYTYAQDSNRLLAVAKAGSDGSFKQRDLSYDAVGNIINDTQFGDQRTLHYSANNRLAEVKKAVVQEGDQAQYRYNAKGQRVSKTVAGITTHFHYDINNKLVAETHVNAVSPMPVRDYVYAAGMRLAIVNYSAASQSEQGPLGVVQFVVNDHLGTPAVMTDAKQDIVWRADATPFGDQIAASSIQPLRFPGQYADAESGYSYNYFRDYDPTLGRYIQSDPIGLAGGINTFGYVAGNPMILVDPNGLEYYPQSHPFHGDLKNNSNNQVDAWIADAPGNRIVFGINSSPSDSYDIDMFHSGGHWWKIKYGTATIGANGAISGNGFLNVYKANSQDGAWTIFSDKGKANVPTNYIEDVRSGKISAHGEGGATASDLPGVKSRGICP